MSVSALFYRGGSGAGSEPVPTWSQFWSRHFDGEKTLNHKAAGEASSDLSRQTKHLFYFHWSKHQVVFGCRREKDSTSSVVVVLGSAGESKSHTDWLMRLYGDSHDVKSKLVLKKIQEPAPGSLWTWITNNQHRSWKTSVDHFSVRLFLFTVFGLNPDWRICELVFTQQHTHTYDIYLIISVCVARHETCLCLLLKKL